MIIYKVSVVYKNLTLTSNKYVNSFYAFGITVDNKAPAVNKYNKATLHYFKTERSAWNIMSDIPPVFLGVLRSEFDNAGNDNEEISEALNLIDHITDGWKTHKLTQDETSALLLQAIWVDSNGILYTIGATTKRWYSKENLAGMWKSCGTPNLQEDADKIGFATTNRNLSVALSSHI